MEVLCRTGFDIQPVVDISVTDYVTGRNGADRCPKEGSTAGSILGTDRYERAPPRWGPTRGPAIARRRQPRGAAGPLPPGRHAASAPFSKTPGVRPSPLRTRRPTIRSA